VLSILKTLGSLLGTTKKDKKSKNKRIKAYGLEV
jgi:hypothetical protein